MLMVTRRLVVLLVCALGCSESDGPAAVEPQETHAKVTGTFFLKTWQMVLGEPMDTGHFDPLFEKLVDFEFVFSGAAFFDADADVTIYKATAERISFGGDSDAAAYLNETVVPALDEFEIRFLVIDPPTLTLVIILESDDERFEQFAIGPFTISMEGFRELNTQGP